MGRDGADRDVPRGRDRGGRRVFWVAFAALAVMTSVWSLASPPGAGPDENAHIVKAAAVVRGDLTGTSTPENPGSGTVVVPAVYAQLMASVQCFAFQPQVSADCVVPPPANPGEPVQVDTWVIRNNPAYYAVVGLPTLLPPGTYAVYLMRIVSAVLCSAALAWGFRVLAELPRPAPVALGLTAAITPMVLFLNSVVNSSGLEISCALALWAGMFVLLRHPDPTRLKTRAAGVAVLAVVLANARGLSLLYLVVIVGVAVLSSPWRNVVTLVSDRTSWPWLALATIGVVGSLAWTFSANTLAGGGAGHPELGPLGVARDTLLETNDFLEVAIGRFGWLDTALPTWLHFSFAALVGFIAILGLVLASRRDAIVLTGVLGIAILLPVLIHAWQAKNVGYIWTARYSMPLYVGLPVVAGLVALERFRALPGWLDRRVVLVPVSLMVIGHLVALVINLRRYVSGEGGSWAIWFGGDWTPPVYPAVLVAGFIATAILGVRALVRVCTAGIQTEPRSVAIGA